MKLQVINIRTELAGTGSNIPISIPKHFSFISWRSGRDDQLGWAQCPLSCRGETPFQGVVGFFKSEKLEQGYPLILQGTKSMYIFIYMYICIYVYTYILLKALLKMMLFPCFFSGPDICYQGRWKWYDQKWLFLNSRSNQWRRRWRQLSRCR